MCHDMSLFKDSAVPLRLCDTEIQKDPAASRLDIAIDCYTNGHTELNRWPNP